MSAAGFTHRAFLHNFDFVSELKPRSSLVDVWFARWGLFWYILLGIPCVFCSVVAIGLARDRWLESPGGVATGLKIASYQVLVLFLAVTYAASWILLVYVGYQSYFFEDLYMSEKVGDKILMHISTSMSLVLLYHGVYLFVTFSVSGFNRQKVWDNAC